MKFYRQIFSDIDRGVKPKNREDSIKKHMENYFPRLAYYHQDDLEYYIEGYVSCEQFIKKIQEKERINAIRSETQEDVVDIFDNGIYALPGTRQGKLRARPTNGILRELQEFGSKFLQRDSSTVFANGAEF